VISNRKKSLNEATDIQIAERGESQQSRVSPDNGGKKAIKGGVWGVLIVFWKWKY